MSFPLWQTLWERIRKWSPLPARRVSPSRRDELLASLAPIGPLRVDDVALPGTDITLQIAHTADFERLLSNSVYDFETDYMPYWAEIWPCGVVLAGAIAREPDVFPGKRVLELGPGVGVTAVAALRAGAELVVADYAPGSLALTALNALDQVGTEPTTLLVNWRSPSREFIAAAGDGFGIVLAADVLYENKDVRPLATLLDRIVAPGGELWLAETGREAAQRLVKLLHRRGWRGESEQCTSSWPDPNYKNFDVVRVHRLRRP